MQQQKFQTVVGYPLALTAESNCAEQSVLTQSTGLSLGKKETQTNELGTGIVVGRIVGLVNSSQPLVSYPQNRGCPPVKARTIALITEKEVGQQAILGFEEGGFRCPIVLGTIKSEAIDGRSIAVTADGDKFILVAEREIELRCGEASIILTRAGKVLIKGEYILTRAKGINRIKGAAVSIN